jgi:LPS sulfotransferase NodH
MPEELGPATRFVILAAPRSGSNLLCTLLNSHPEVLCHHEIFNPAGIFYALDHRDGSLDLGTIEARDRAPAAFLERLWRARLGQRSTGFKFTRGQDERALEIVLHDRGIRKIVLRRINQLKSYVSAKIAEKTGQWEVYREADLVANRPKIAVDFEEFRRHAAENDRFYAGIEQVLDRTGQSPLCVNYERLFDEDEQARWSRFLGVSRLPVPLRAASVKQNPTDLRRIISNYDDILIKVRGSAMEAELCSLES